MANEGNNTDMAVVSNANKQQALDWLGPTFLIGGGVGALGGIYEAYKRRQKAKELASKAIPPDAPVAPVWSPKVAQETLSSSSPPGGWFHQTPGTDPSFWKGDYSGSMGVMGVPWAPLALMGTGLLGYYAGKKPIDMISRNNTSADLQEDLDEARKRYFEAIRRGPPTLPQDTIQKAASDPGWFSMERWGPYLGVGAGGLGAMGLASFMSGYIRKKKEQDLAAARARQESLANLDPSRVPLQPIYRPSQAAELES